MRLKDLFHRWRKGEDERAVERAEQESQMTGHERAVDQEDFEARKDDVAAGLDWPAAEAEQSASDDL